LCELTTLLCSPDVFADVAAEIEGLQIDCAASCLHIVTGAELALLIRYHGSFHARADACDRVVLLCPSALLQVLGRENILHEGHCIDHIDRSDIRGCHRCDGESCKERESHHVAVLRWQLLLLFIYYAVFRLLCLYVHVAS
jgi:hypothetical protein